MSELMNTCKRQWLGIVELPGLHSLLLFLQSCQHVSQVELNRGFTLLPCCFGECFLQGEERRIICTINRLVMTTRGLCF